MASFDRQNNLFQGSGAIMGLSGGGGSAVALDDSNSFYNFRLRRHYTDDELVEQPDRIWFTNDDHAARTGLGPHIADVLTDGQRFSDVLIVLSEDDHEECFDEHADYGERVTEIVRKAFSEFVAKSALRPSDRPLGVWIVKDGSREIGGTEFGLVEGEFITGIMPNLYRGKGPKSKPVIALHINIPGAWEGYREVGLLYDDQMLFTVGNHWLDNFGHDNLREAALYRLQREPDGAFFHIINPDLQGRYKVNSTDQGGTSVITLATADDEPLAYIVLAVVEDDDLLSEWDEPAALDEAPALEPVAAKSATSPSPSPSPSPAPAAAKEVDAPFRPSALEPGSMPASPRSRGSKTIIPEAQSERIFTLQERGALLQKVHFSAFMLGYDVYVGFRGELGTVVDHVAATFQVRKKTVSLLANADNVSLDGESIPAGESRLIEGDATIQVGNQRLDYRDLRHITVDGWPYVGEIRRPASSTYMLWGREYTIGRSRDSRVVLPDEPRNDNIVWKPKIGDGATIKSKTGEIPKSRFYTDSIMVASEHAAVELIDDEPHLSCHARHCYTFVRRHGEVITLYPTEAGSGDSRVPLESGDEILIGNCLFYTGFTASDGSPATPTAPPPAVVAAPLPSAAPRVISSDSLVDAVSEPDFVESEPAPASFGAADEVSRAPMPTGNLPEDVEEAPPARVEAQAEAALRAPQRSSPGFSDDDLADAPPPPSRATPKAAPPSPPAEPKPAPRTPAPSREPAPPPAAAGDVVVVDDHDAQFELGRPARLVLVGWAVNGSVTCGNHAGADLVIPESRIEPGQTFAARDYFQLKIRGRRSRLESIDADEVLIDAGPPAAEYADCSAITISVIRRDDEGEEDFTVDLTVAEDAALPDPRARLVALDTDEPLAVALLTRGFPVRAPREVELNGLALTGTFDGSRLQLSDYLEGYRIDGGFRAFFVQSGGKGGGERFVTAPEDGAPIELAAGDRLVIDGAVYRFDVT